ncbi:MAG: endospore germination permease [Firmicutes bacterium]|nr:endospore germination permease [Bacillota bacterium]
MGIEKGRISSRQATFLIANTILATGILFLPALMAREAGQDSWASVLIAAFFGLLLGALVVSLGLRFPGKNIVEYASELLGPWGGRALGILLALFFFYLNGIIIREFGELLVTAVMPETPLVVFNALLVIMAAYGVYLGLEVFARVNEIIFPFSLLVGLVTLALAVPEMDFFQLQPVLVHSFVHILRGAGSLFAFFGEGMVFTMFLPCLRRPEEAHWVNLQVVFLLVAAGVSTIAGVIALFGAEETARLVFPTYELAKTVHLAGFLERIESLIVGVWVAAVGLKVMVIYYAAVVAFAQSLGLQDYRPLVLPSGLVLVALSILEFADNDHVREFLARYWGPFGITVQAGIPLLLFLLALARKKGISEKEAPGQGEGN